MTTKKLTDYIKQSTSTQSTKREEQPKPAQARIQFKKETKFQETPIGKMPKDWRLERLSNISSEIKAGGTPLRSRREYWNGDIPFVKIEDMTNSFKYLLTTSETITRKGLENSNAWLVPENSLLLAIYGSLGEVVINKIKVATNQAILAIIPRNPKDVEYLYYWFLYYKPNWKKYAKPTTQPNLTKEIVENALLPYPPSSEREKIAEILSTVDLAIDRVRRLVERAEKLKKGLMQELFTKGIRHKEYIETPIGKIPKEWRVVRLGEVCNPVREIIEPRSSDISAPYVGLEHVEPGRFFLTRWGTAEEVISSKYKFRKGDILYGRLRPYLDKCVIATIDGLCSTDFIVIRANANLILPEYMVAILHTEKFIKYATSTMRGTNHPRTSWESISRYLLPLPPINEQAEISNVLLSIDRYIGLLKNKHELLSHIKRSLMNILLTGKVRIIVNSSEGVSGG